MGWKSSDIPDLTGKVAVVTDGNGGLGFETSKQLAAHCATVVIGAQNLAKAEVGARWGGHVTSNSTSQAAVVTSTISASRRLPSRRPARFGGRPALKALRRFGVGSAHLEEYIPQRRRIASFVVG